MTPRLDLLMQDGSILLNQPIDVLMPEKGLLQYNVPENVTKHVGKVNCKLFWKVILNLYTLQIFILKFLIVVSKTQ